MSFGRLLDNVLWWTVGGSTPANVLTKLLVYSLGLGLIPSVGGTVPSIVVIFHCSP